MPGASIRCNVPVNASGFLPFALKQYGGYYTAAFGKYHLGMYKSDTIPTRKGFDSFIGFLGPNIISKDGATQFFGYRCACKTSGDQGQCDNHLISDKTCYFFRDMVNITSSDTTVLKTISRDAIRDSRGKPKYDHTDMFLADQIALQIFQSSAKPEPFFIHAGWISPHDPQDGPERTNSPIKAGTKGSGMSNNAGLQAACQPSLGSARIINLGIVGILDDAHRVVIDALDQVDELDSTIFIFVTTSGKFSTLHKDS
jgi:hypothetical protein